MLKSKSALLLFVLLVASLPTYAANQVIVPKIDGNCDDVDKIIKASGLKPKRIDVHGPDDKDAGYMGCAYRQTPKAGKKVKKGSTLKYRTWWEAG